MVVYLSQPTLPVIIEVEVHHAGTEIIFNLHKHLLREKSIQTVETEAINTDNGMHQTWKGS